MIYVCPHNMMDFPTFVAVSVSPPGGQWRRLRGESPKRSQQLQTVISWWGPEKRGRFVLRLATVWGPQDS